MYKEIYPPFLCVPLAEMIFRQKNLYCTQRMSNWNWNLLWPYHHIVFSFSSCPRFSNVPLPPRFSKWNVLCIFNFSSSYPLPHLSNCLSVHLPPTFTHRYKSCSSSLCNFVQPPATLSDVRTNVSLSRCPNTKHKHKHTPSNTIFCNR